jgi:hypothetical protein
VDAIVRHVDRRNMLWRIGMLKRLLILIGWYRDEIGNRLEVKPSHQIVDSNSHASDVARSTQAAGSPILLLKQHRGRRSRRRLRRHTTSRMLPEASLRTSKSCQPRYSLC